METLPYRGNERKWDALAKHLFFISSDICEANECTEDEHKCESYAYISQTGDLNSICPSDYFQGWGSRDVERWGEIAVIPLPWSRTGEELRDAVDENIDHVELIEGDEP